MIAAVTHHDAAYILWRMPLAQGLQYQAIWIDMDAAAKGRPERTAPAHRTERAVSFARLAG